MIKIRLLLVDLKQAQAFSILQSYFTPLIIQKKIEFKAYIFTKMNSGSHSFLHGNQFTNIRPPINSPFHNDDALISEPNYRNISAIFLGKTNIY